MHGRYRQIYKIYKMTKNKDVRLYCIYLLIWEGLL
jgi:hypothetical protein